MRWLALWLLLILTYAAGWAVTGLLLGRLPSFGREALAHFAAIPLVQLLALAALRIYRKAPKARPAASREGREESGSRPGGADFA